MLTLPALGYTGRNTGRWTAGMLFAASRARIKLADGPFAGMEAVFAEQDGEKRVIVLLELLGKTNKVRVVRDWVARAA